MRRREILDTRWELRSFFGVVALHRDDAIERRDKLRGLGIDAGVYRVRRFAPAKLRAVKRRWNYDPHRVEWRITSRPCSATIAQCEHEWHWHLCGTTDDHTAFDLRGIVRSFSGHAAFVAVAEAARTMGYRLPPAPEKP
jgi:hypothetical protein